MHRQWSKGGTSGAALVIFSLLLLGCGPKHGPLDARSRVQLEDAEVDPSSLGRLIYEGNVYAGKAEVPAPLLYRYERRSSQSQGKVVSTHTAYTPKREGGEVVVLQRATHTSDYRLLEFSELHAQTGHEGRVLVAADGSLQFERTHGGKRKTMREAGGAPVVVGPTLFGYVLENWEALKKGETLKVRYADVGNLCSYGFALSLLRANDEDVVIRFVPTSFFVRLGLSEMRMTFDASTRKIRRYEGRVPPLREEGERLKAFDARVEYQWRASALNF